MPVNLHQADLPLFASELVKTIPLSTAVELTDVTITPGGAIFHGGRLWREAFVSAGPIHRLRVTVEATLARLRVKARQRLDDEVVWCTDDWSANYYHWLTDAVPRVFAARQKYSSADLLLPSRLRSLQYVTPSLAPLGTHGIKYLKPTEALLCRKVIVPLATAPTGNYDEVIVNALRDLYVRSYGSDDRGRAGLRIYISRRLAQRRQIANEPDVIRVLQEFDFEDVCLEEHSFEEQVGIISQARYLVSNHGAGLTNMLFMKPRGRVLELRREGDAHNNCFFSLASALGLPYHYQLCRAARRAVNPRSSDLIVDVTKLRNSVSSMLSS